jgi:hypothetical protein
MEQCVPKHRYVKFRRQGITQKKAYNVRKMLRKHVRHESNESEQGFMAELCEHEKETWIPLT